MRAFDRDSHLDEMKRSAPPVVDLTEAAHLARVTAIAEDLLERYRDPETLAALDADLAARRAPAAVRLAAKLARSRRAVAALEPPVHVTVVFAVYREHRRILPRAQHPHGEDFLARKLEQLHWLFDGRNVGWEVIVVDDGCPRGSGRIAERRMAELGAGDRVRVLFLADAIAGGVPVVAALDTTEQSRKGGAILYGLWQAARAEHQRHAVVYTDADLSTHLGQTGLLLEPILTAGKAAAVGSRREPTSLAVKRGLRDRRGKLFIYLWKRLIPILGPIIDTQCGFKAFRAEMVRRVAGEVEERGFAFDIELLARIELRRPGAIAVVPTAWIDSEAESTTTALEPYLPMLRSVVRLYRTRLPATAAADAFAELIDSLDPAAWDRLVRDVPTEIAGREPAALATFDGVSAADLARRARAARPRPSGRPGGR